MKPLAIHSPAYGWTPRWIQYCDQKAIPYKIVNCYRSDIVSQLKGCSSLLWHWNYENYRDKQFANNLIRSVELMGIKTIPNYESSWHFDDKIAQKYLLESLNEPFINSWVFYEKKAALEWINTADYPLVFKLKTGAGSQNVKLVNNQRQAKRIINIAFGTGFSSKNYKNIIIDRCRKLLKNKDAQAFKNLGKSVYRVIKPVYDLKFINKEKGYVYFQEFLADNKFDTRLIVIGNRCFGLRRFNRKNDFRASGSGILSYEHEKIDMQAVRAAFSIARKINSRTLALDFLYDTDGIPSVAEISYAFPYFFCDECPGFWDSRLNWNSGNFIVQHLMIDDLLADLS